MYLLKFYLTILILVNSIFTVLIFASPQKFGKFDVLMERYEYCKGPRPKNCTKWDMRIEDKKILHFDLITLQKIEPLKVKVVMACNGKDLVRLQMATVCDNAFLKPMFRTLFNATNRCVIPKGHFHQLMNMEEVLQQYYGGEFFYGNMSFKSVITNNECNFSCSTLYFVTVPKKSN